MRYIDLDNFGRHMFFGQRCLEFWQATHWGKLLIRTSSQQHLGQLL